MTRFLALCVFAVVCAQGCSIGYEILRDEGIGAVGDGGTGASDGNGGSSPGGDGAGGDDGTGGAPDPACEAWLENDLIHRRQLTFDNRSASGPLEDFTALVVLTAQTFDYDSTAPFGADLRFVDAGTGAPLSHHVDTWNEGALSTIWVKVPRIAANANDHIWVYYGGADTAPQAPANTYDDDYLAVWHLSERSGTLASSASGPIPLTWVGGGMSGQGAPGRIGSAIELDGNPDGANSMGGELDGLNDHTITLWAQPDAGGGGDAQQTLFSAEDDTGAPFAGAGLYFNERTGQIGTWADGTYQFSSETANQLVVGEWAFIALRASVDASNGVIEVKVNGGEWEEVFAGDTSTAAAVPGSTIQVGNWIGPLDAYFRGRIDEIQVSQGLRTDDWVDTQYRSQAHLGFVAVGDEDTCND